MISDFTQDCQSTLNAQKISWGVANFCSFILFSEVDHWKKITDALLRNARITKEEIIHLVSIFLKQIA
jgi:hypothetical protein